MSTTPVPTPNTSPNPPTYMPVPQSLEAPGKPQGLGTTPADQTSGPAQAAQHPQAKSPMPAPGQSATPNPVRQPASKAQVAAASSAHATATLPQAIGQSVQAKKKEQMTRENLTLKTYIDNHFTAIQKMQTVNLQLKPMAEQIQKHMEDLKDQPASAQKTMSMSYLAHSMKSIVAALKTASAEIKTARQQNQAIASDPKNAKIISKALGYDEKSANDPLRQFAVQQVAQKTQEMQKNAMPAPEPQGAPVASGGTQLPSQPSTASPQASQGGWKHRLGQIGQVIGDLLIPQKMAAIPGTEEHKAMLQQRALALQEALAKMQGQEATANQKNAQAEEERAQAKGVVPAEEKTKEAQEKIAETARANQAKEAQAAAAQQAAQAYHQATLALQKAKVESQNDPNNLQNKMKLERLKIESQKAQAALKTAAEGDEGNQQLAQMLINHQLAPSELPGFGKQRAEVLKQAAKLDPTYNPAAADRAYKYATNAATQNTLNYLESLTGSDNKSGNLGILIQMSDALPRTKFPPINRPDLWAKLQEGNPQVAAYYSAVVESADQVAKILQGGTTGSATSDRKLQQANDLFNKGFNAEQMKSVAGTLRTLLGNRKDALIRDNPFLGQQFGSDAQSQGSGSDPLGILH